MLNVNPVFSKIRHLTNKKVEKCAKWAHYEFLLEITNKLLAY